MTFTRIGTAPLDVAEHEAAVADASAGAVVVFTGVVRDHDGGRTVRELEYQAHPSAADVLAGIVADVVDGIGSASPAASGPTVRVAVSHRVGRLAIGDVAIVVAVSSAHRALAFATCAQVVDEVKRRLPVWKRQVFADGTDEWVNCP